MDEGHKESGKPSKSSSKDSINEHNGYNEYIIILVIGFALGVIFVVSCPSVFKFVHVLPTKNANDITIIHSPENGNKIIDIINSANKTIDIEVYLLTSRDIISALEQARDRGVIVKVIMEKRVMGGANEKAFNTLESKNISVKWASNIFQLTHSKIIIVDDEIIIVGSHNLSYSALNKNREISLLVDDPSVANQLDTLFEQDWLLASKVYGH